jgi:hypothetical protein
VFVASFSIEVVQRFIPPYGCSQNMSGREST